MTAVDVAVLLRRCPLFSAAPADLLLAIATRAREVPAGDELEPGEFALGFVDVETHAAPRVIGLLEPWATTDAGAPVPLPPRRDDERMIAVAVADAALLVSEHAASAAAMLSHLFSRLAEAEQP